jgi:hypothetical protein
VNRSGGQVAIGPRAVQREPLTLIPGLGFELGNEVVPHFTALERRRRLTRFSSGLITLWRLIT